MTQWTSQAAKAAARMLIVCPTCKRLVRPCNLRQHRRAEHSPPGGPPVRPRYRIVAVSGYGETSNVRKTHTTWTVHDRLHQGFAVSAGFYDEEQAEAERAQLEARWERWLEERGYVL